ncbi:MAG: cysteine--tRNA ligase [Calditrichaeota bacterium]|nr:cysteine--tRNA ligase [Candidatus Cloacimonadota bacterium]MCB1047070.1 cysteine--tRNA ligase [Calditrichota bacterium]MCB9474794.1 cysteine--tRNA ligase [Candidatus Delongbacteria bacterium]
MAIRFYNSMGREKQDFVPLIPGKVSLYTCGPTVHNYAHIGNFRTFLFEDLLRRFLRFRGLEVTQVMNITDVDDKTIRRSQEEGQSLGEYTGIYLKAFMEDLDTLRIERAEHYPAATDHTPEMVEMIKQLRERGHTYEHKGSIYFRLSSYPEYGRLSNVAPDQMVSSGRVDNDEYEKDDVRDFVLWKAWVPEDGDVFWETELGKGRPGWHLECSAMSIKYLGEHFDIHTGGVDNRFPHHENEIAQSVCATGHPFVNYWMHSEFLLVENAKMSKSKGNFFTLRDLVGQGFDPVAIRFTILRVHYRQQMNLSTEGLEQGAAAVRRIREFARRLAAGLDGSGAAEETARLVETCRRDFTEAMDDDLNTSGALGHFFTFLREANALADAGKLSAEDGVRMLGWVQEVDSLFAILAEERDTDLESQVEALVQARSQAKADKDWARADSLRQQISELGYTVKDTPQGPVWSRD